MVYDKVDSADAGTAIDSSKGHRKQTEDPPIDRSKAGGG